MVDVAAILQLSYQVAKAPSDVKVNKFKCQLLADRVVSLAGHLERMQGLGHQDRLEKSHEDALVRAHSVILECKKFMAIFEDGMWMKKALFKEQDREQFRELHESITYVCQTLQLEIDYQSLTRKSSQAEAADVAHMEHQLVLMAANMEKLERSVTELTDENQKQHYRVLAALKDIRIYRKTLNQDQLKAALAEAREEESVKEDGSTTEVTGSTFPLGIIGSRTSRPPSPGAKRAGDAVGEAAGISLAVPNANAPLPGRPPTDSRGQPYAAMPPRSSLGPSLHHKPYSQSHGVGLAATVSGGGWFHDTVSFNEAVVGEGGAKRGEYEVSFGEGQMGMSLKNVEARAEVSKVEAGGAAHAAGVRPGDNVVGVNGKIPLGYTQVMSTLPLAPRPVRIRFIRGQGATVSPGGSLKKSHSSTWASNAVTAGVHHPAGDKGVLLEMYARASFSQTPWVRSEGWDGLPVLSTIGDMASSVDEPSADATAQGAPAQKDAFVNKKQDEGSNANNTDDLCRWSGVRVGRASKVIELRLPGNNMHGVLPPSMGSLEELRTIELRENRLEGNIPESLRYLQKLAKVDLAHNLLEGSVPAGDARWINSMATLLLNNNKLSGHIPSTLGRLVNLTQLDLSFNALSGSVPPELSSARSLEVLSLAHNGIMGPLPFSFGNLTRLKILNISNNKLTGPLPEMMGKMTSLQELRLRHNRLSGIIPDDILAIASLLLVDLSSNELEGQIPNSLGARSENLTDLDISKNSLSGEIPSNIGGLRKLKKLNLENNMIEGALPTSLANLKALEDLNLSGNNLTGPLLHIQWGNMSNLEHLHLANNKLGESLPASLGSLTSLVSLTLNANQLTGSIPRELHDMTGLKLLDLSGNKIAPSLLARSFFSGRRTLKKKLSACDVRF